MKLKEKKMGPSSYAQVLIYSWPTIPDYISIMQSAVASGKYLL
jgi:hypothetical protein